MSCWYSMETESAERRDGSAWSHRWSQVQRVSRVPPAKRYSTLRVSSGWIFSVLVTVHPLAIPAKALLCFSSAN